MGVEEDSFIPGFTWEGTLSVPQIAEELVEIAGVQLSTDPPTEALLVEFRVEYDSAVVGFENEVGLHGRNPPQVGLRSCRRHGPFDPTVSRDAKTILFYPVEAGHGTLEDLPHSVIDLPNVCEALLPLPGVIPHILHPRRFQ